MAFSNIPGNERVKKILQAFIEKERLPHALIFAGPEGSGKKLMALGLAKALNCEKSKIEPCNECSQCNSIDNENHPDVIIISPEGQFIKIDQMRFLIQTAYLKPMVGYYRVYIIDQAEKLNEEASNAILKILEEPPSFTIIILITNNPSFLLPTIRSRCQIIPFSSIKREEIESILRENGYDEEKARLISLLAEGNLEKALSFDWEVVFEKKQKAFEIFKNLIKKENIFQTYKRLERESYSSGFKEEFRDFLELMISFCRDIILLKEGGDTRYLLNPNFLLEFKEIERFVDQNEIQKYMEEIENLIYSFEKNVKIRMLMDYLFSIFAFREEGRDA
ncbi:DNA polymerase III subunit delta' [Candidatus Aminicenantes bacterium AC-335-A11]|jgi:DNA polymerase-3 subunit delta'|nr:DNA polymerase III subunit delta' [SCandidatus Aminicenantes bacterium Aminicenantia_JdfR_composite]MCP2596631.1 DNA polymerase III subunit delta' [Candidatus Aminicenantes bacterium AC-335-G13]MCP2598043.1 DNA polymerase III subunit delta' [Candidatus Aminicenantes bacterium AC-335-L06]MCP2618373.1 DNA polymerase III subunit delta' [Candidatus Aminicenantes bacterium AC-335-A11]